VTTTHQSTLADDCKRDRRSFLSLGAGLAAAGAALSCHAAREVAGTPEPLSEDERQRLDELFADLTDESDEPGIYLYGELGVRPEDIVAVTADGAEHFGTWQKTPASPA